MADNKKSKEQKRERRYERRNNRKALKRAVLEQLPKGSGRVYLTIGLLFFVLLFSFAAVNLLGRDKEYSENENRMLAQRPGAVPGNIMDGRFMKQYEEYQSDQFVGRDFWIQLKTLVDSFSGKTEENGVFNGKNAYLLEDIAEPDKEELQDNLKAMKDFQQKYSGIKMHVMLVPNAANILKRNLPAFAVTADQSALMNQVRAELGAEFNWIDVEKTMINHADEDIYYRTDHHWTTLGAYYAFQDAAEALGITKEQQIPMKAYGVSNNFNGTLSAMSGYQTGYKEAIHIYLPEGENTPQIVVNYVEEQKKSASLYDSSRLKEKDKYAMFLGGNHPVVEIKSDTERTDRLLVIKDSYANCFIPFLAPYYREILVVDPRYYTGDMEKLMEENKITSVLFLYNANTFFKDRMLSGVLPVDSETE